MMLVSYLWRVQNAIPFSSLFQAEPQVTSLPTAEPRDGSNIADSLHVSEGLVTPDQLRYQVDG